MSWASLTNNQCISCNNLQDGVNNNVFTLKNAIPVSNKQVTKNEAEFYVNIQNITNRSANELVIKSDVISSGSTTTTSTTQVPTPCGNPTSY
jgi:orotate phosphoribosyltransferase-like protein